jgi:hypothetical protein
MAKMTDIRKCPLHGDMYLTKAFDGAGNERTILECPVCDYQQLVLSSEDIERIGKKAAESGAICRAEYRRY